MKTFVRTEIVAPMAIAVLFIVTSLATGLIAQQPAAKQPAPPTGAAIDPPWTSALVIQAGDLSRMVADKKAEPHIFQVGFETMYKTQHVPGSVYAGPGRTDAGLEILKKAVAGVPKDQMIVLYCGCCPWDRCPNMKPAFKVLHELGYAKVKVVEIPSSFGVDWVDKGYPVEGSAAH